MPVASPPPDLPVESAEPVRVLRVSALCPARIHGCAGTLVSDGHSRPLMTPLGPDAHGRLLYRHACVLCRRAAWLTEAYPKITYEPLTDGAEAADE